MTQGTSKQVLWDLTDFSQHLFHCSEHCEILCWNLHQLSRCIFLNVINGLKSLPFQRWFYFWEILFPKSCSLVVVWIKSLAIAAWCSFRSSSRSRRTDFASTHFVPRSCVKISDTVAFGTPRSASSSHTVSHWSLLIAACTCSTFSGVLLVAGLPECGSLLTDSQPLLKHLGHTFIFVPHLLLCPQKPSESSQ